MNHNSAFPGKSLCIVQYIHTEKFYLNLAESNQISNMDCKYTSPINLAPNGFPIGNLY